MKKVNTSPISGTQELLPEKQAEFDCLKQKIAEKYKAHGYLNVETPMIERAEILLAKAGGETEKQIYRVAKTGEDLAEADEALRFDHTVPLARYIVEHESELSFPFKVAQLGENFRGERAQRGRYREFYQCDVDVIGRNVLPIEYDADVISTMLDTYKSFGLKTPINVRISNRKILSGLIEGLNLQEKATDIYRIIDHSEKVSAEKTDEALSQIGLSDAEKAKILRFIDIKGSDVDMREGLAELGVENETLKDGILQLDKVLKLLEKSGYNYGEIKVDMRIVRGLDYYTGTVFEFSLPEYPEIGSVGGGGRYDNLTEYFSEQKFPGVGGSIGLNRLYFVLNEKKLLKKTTLKPLDIAIIPMDDDSIEFSLTVAKKFRDDNKKVTIVYGDKKLADKMKYAAKIAESAVVIGEKERESGIFDVKKFE